MCRRGLFMQSEHVDPGDASIRYGTFFNASRCGEFMTAWPKMTTHMRFMSQGIGFVIAISILKATASIAGELVSTPKQVMLLAGDEIQQKSGRLYEVDPARHKVAPVRVSTALDRELKTSSSVIFPDDQSRKIDGKEYFLIVINHASTSNPTGYCGAGEESVLYVLELEDNEVVSRFSLPVRSCLNDYDLADDSGQKSEYRSIEWSDSPQGIGIRWDIYGDVSNVSRFYINQGGNFKEVVK
jgi:hypothetical protein